jgi:hypothetical protein
MKTIKDVENFAQQFLDQEMESFEVYLATTQDNIVHHTGYDDLSDTLGDYREALIDDFRFERSDSIANDLDGSDSIANDLDDFIKESNQKVDKDTVLYRVLLRKFLKAKIESLSEQIKMCGGHDYSYTSLVLRDLNVSVKNFSKSSRVIAKNIDKWKTEATRVRQERVNKIAKQVMKEYPDSTKESLSEDVFLELKKIDKKVKSSSNILRTYLDSYPNF